MRYVLSICFLFGIAFSNAKTPKPVSEQAYEELVKEYTFEKQKWSLVPKEMDLPKESPENMNSSNWGSSGAFDFLGYIIIITLIGLILYFILANLKHKKKQNKKEDDASGIDDIEEIDVERGYENAIANGDYRLAIRMQFVKLLQSLNERRIITWKNEKTNRDYINEIKDLQVKKNFKFLSSVFERTWYGNKNIDATAFGIADAHFNLFFKMRKHE